MFHLHNTLIFVLLITTATISHGLPQTPPLSPPASLLSPLTFATSQNLTDDDEHHCFTDEDANVHPANEEKCALAIADIANRDGIKKYEQTRTFISGNAKGLRPFKVPDQWSRGRPPDSCEVHIFGLDDTKDVFRLKDVADKAQELVDRCLRISKKGYGGIVPVGPEKQFIVGVNGYIPPKPPGAEANYTDWMSIEMPVEDIMVS